MAHKAHRSSTLPPASAWRVLAFDDDLRRSRGQRIGLFGGSFNPPHLGHWRLAQQALKSLKLDEVWWLVSPQNPLKSTDETAVFEERLHQCQYLAQGLRHRVTALEHTLDVRYTLESMQAIKRLFPKRRFVWLMGADSLVDFHRWHQWYALAHTMPIAVFARPFVGASAQGHTVKALASPVACQLQRFRVARSSRYPRAMPTKPLPCWRYVFSKHHSYSSRAIRRGLIL